MLLSALAAAIVAVAAPSTTASRPAPFAGADSIRARMHIVRLHDGRSRSCNARPPRDRTGTVERQLNPVACEQPPRSKVAVTVAYGGELLGGGR